MSAIAWRPEEHCRLVVRTGTSYPKVFKTATRAVTAAAEPPRTLPTQTSCTTLRGRRTRDTASVITEARSVSVTGGSPFPGRTRRVKGVREIETITGSLADILRCRGADDGRMREEAESK